jgi:hypothetical protein
MNSTSITIVLVIAIFALIIVDSFLVFRKRGKVRINAPLGLRLEVDASNKTTERKPVLCRSMTQEALGEVFLLKIIKVTELRLIE